MIHVPGRVGMEECSLDFFLIRDRPFVFSVFFFWLGTGADLFYQLKLDFLDKVKGFIFCNHKKYFLQLLLAPIRFCNFSFIQLVNI